ncbi:MAG: hypothetical protein J5765_02200 [Clostridia bacterium]|nr:hypothetical protein [Clostridia bacterium]
MAYQLTKDKDGSVLFGYYPQTRKSKTVTITDAPNEYGVCGGSDGCRYLATRGDYFKIEPIRWRVLKEKDGKLLLLSEMILDFRPFDEGGTNSYLWSDLSDWLDDDFFYDAFSPTERRMILATSIRCDEESATPPPGVLSDEVFQSNWAGAVDPQNAETFKDKVFLFGVRNVTQPDFGFREDPYAFDENRVARLTDYAKAASGDPSDTAAWWLRSPIPHLDCYVRVVGEGGNADGEVYVADPCGVRPVIRIKT